MHSIALEATTRELGTKSELKLSRREGLIPVNIYGKSQANSYVSLNQNALKKAFRQGLNESTIIELSIQGKDWKEFTVIKEVQRHPVRGDVMHMDLHLISLDEPISTFVPIEITGQSMGIKMGGHLEHGIRELNIETLPQSIPQSILIDISHLQMGQSIHVDQLTVDSSIKVLTEGKTFVVGIAKPKGMTESEIPGLESSENEPEVIEKGKKPSEV